MNDLNKRVDGQGQINFNFTIEQQAKFDNIYAETQRLYPQLCGDEISLHRTKILIAHSVLTNDAPLTREDSSQVDDNIVKIDLDDKE